MFKVHVSHVRFVVMLALVALLAATILAGAGFATDAVAGMSVPGYTGDDGGVAGFNIGGGGFDGDGGNDDGLKVAGFNVGGYHGP